MKLSPELATQIISINNVGEAVRLLRAYNDEGTLDKEIRQITYGIKTKFHYKKYEEGNYVEKNKPGTKGGYFVIDGQHLPVETVWDEIDARISEAQKLLLELLEEKEVYELE